CGAGLAYRRVVEAGIAALAIAVGVLWSNTLQYHKVWLAPRAQLHELEAIGNRIAGQGPTLMTDYQAYGARHLLRRASPEGASELRRRFDYLTNGKTLDKGESADIDRFRLDGVLVYRTLVLLRGPAEIRSHETDMNGLRCFCDLGTVPLADVRNLSTLRSVRGDWRPGSASTSFSDGPAGLSAVDSREPVETVAPADARSLCGKRLDW